MAQVKVSDFVAKFIAEQGVTHVFMISGGGNMHLIDSIGNNPDLTYVCNHHEQACAIAAESYARATENLGVCLATTGPGAVNALSGLIGAWLDSIPTLYISGQVKRHDIGQLSGLRALGVQEVNIVDMARSVTKYAELIMEPTDIKYHLQKAVFLAKAGRPGPVWLDIPLDVQAVMVEESDLKEFDPKKEILAEKPNLNLEASVKKTLEYLRFSQRPVIIAGHGVRLAKAHEEFIKLAEACQIPVLTAMSAHDLIPSGHPLFAGRHGGFGDRAGNFAVQNADLILTIGSRNHLWNIGYQYELFGRGAKKIVVDIDPAELSKKTLRPDLAICADAKEFILGLLFQVKAGSLPDISPWRKRCQAWLKKYPVVLEEYKKDFGYVNSYYFTQVLSQIMPEGEQVVLADGTAFTGTLQAIFIKPNQRVYYNVGSAAMGWDLPAAIGVCFAKNKKRVVTIAGDGSIMLNIQELQTIKHHNLPIKIFLLNNQGYLAIRNTQNAFFQGRLVASGESSGVSFPDFKKLFKSFGIPYIAMHENSEAFKVIAEVLAAEGPVACEIFMDPNQTLYPKITSVKKPDGAMVSKPLEDMFPFLDRKEFKENMIVPPVNEEV